MSYSEELSVDLSLLRNKTDIDIDSLIELAADKERAKIFEKLVELIQEKDSSNDEIAVEVLAWAWQRLSTN